MAPLQKPSYYASLVSCFLLVMVASFQGVKVEGVKTPTSRKLLATLTHDYTFFCSSQNYSSFHPVFQTPFTTGVDYISAIDVCNLAGIKVQSTGEQLLNPTITGTFTEETVPNGRRLSLHLEGSGVFATGASFETRPEPTRFLGVNPLRETTPALSKEELLLVVATATSFKYDLIWEMADGKSLGDPVTIDYFNIFDPDLATFLLEEMFVTVQGPIRPTPRLSYTPGQQAIIFQHQRQTSDAYIDPFTPSGTPLINDININVLSPDANTARTAEIIAQVVALNPPVGSAPPNPPAGSGPGSSSPVGSGPPGTCDVKSANPNRCFNAGGTAHVCCPGNCPLTAGADPACG